MRRNWAGAALGALAVNAVPYVVGRAGGFEHSLAATSILLSNALLLGSPTFIAGVLGERYLRLPRVGPLSAREELCSWRYGGQP